MVAAGLGVSGVATYAFLAVADRNLDPEAYAAVGVLWSLLFAVGNGVMQPLEQEVARAVSARRARGIGAGPVVRRAGAIGAGFTVVVVALALLVEQLAVLGVVPEAATISHLLDDDATLVGAFLLGLAGFAAGHLVRGTLSSNGRFRGYALFFGTEGATRVVLAVVLAAAGVAVAGAYGLIAAVAPFVGVVAGLWGQHGLLEPGPPAEWSELTKALGWLLAGTASLALIVQGGTIAVDVLADPDEAEAAGVFLNGLVIARIPLFLFQAVLASLLPRLSRLAGTGALEEFRRTLGRLVAAILVVGAFATVAAAVVGPPLIDAVFSSSAGLGPRDLGLLTGTFVLIMAAVCVDQALIALSGHRLMALGWVMALAVFVAVTAAGEDLFLRVELGLLAAAVSALVWMVAWLRHVLAHHPTVVEVSFAEAVAEAPLQD